jgi:Druantia protein DruA
VTHEATAESPTFVRTSGLCAGAREIALIRDVVHSCGLSRQELAATVCELLGWRRPSGRLKTREALDVLTAMGEAGLLELPDKKAGRPMGSKTLTRRTERSSEQAQVLGTVADVAPVECHLVQHADDHALWRELVDRHHPLGYRMPFGASLRYLVWISKPRRQVAACIQVSSPAWRMAARDEWIGWSDARRAEALQHIVNQSRFLILPWIDVRNLASHVLAQSCRALPEDWESRFGLRPWLIETLVDRSQYEGTCYRAAGWIRLGVTSGRGRNDRHHARHGEAPKWLFVRALSRRGMERLRGEG